MVLNEVGIIYSFLRLIYLNPQSLHFVCLDAWRSPNVHGISGAWRINSHSRMCRPPSSSSGCTPTTRRARRICSGAAGRTASFARTAGAETRFGSSGRAASTSAATAGSRPR